MKGTRKLMKLEIKPGMYIRDKEFYGITGVTRYSLMFWNQIKDRLNTIIEAQMLFSDRNWYRLMLTTADDVKIVLYGCSSGYHGEGSRGTAQILKEAGFNPKRVDEVVFSNETFILRRRVKAKFAA